jgi:hypothetical protein
MNCAFCGKELTGSIDTFGAIGQEVCQSCWLEHGNAEVDMPDVWYGLAPHVHQYDANGNIIIGGTKILYEGKEPIEVDGATFCPDPESPGCGVWTTQGRKK